MDFPKESGGIEFITTRKKSSRKSPKNPPNESNEI